MAEDKFAGGKDTVGAMPKDHREKIWHRTNEKANRRDQHASGQLQIDVILSFLFSIEFRFVDRRFDSDRWGLVPFL